jgi:hypothetical protein
MGDIDNKKKVSPPSTFKIILNDGQTYGDEYSDAKETINYFFLIYLYNLQPSQFAPESQ